ncbi:hypothetical protein DLM76_00620 [Leptospira yasudae]|nr:hypothetical protein DLM76_00620 [Leptospira yasudae]
MKFCGENRAPCSDGVPSTSFFVAPTSIHKIPCDSDCSGNPRTEKRKFDSHFLRWIGSVRDWSEKRVRSPRKRREFASESPKPCTSALFS